MNYLTAIVALPLFLLIWLFEMYLMLKHGHNIKPNNKALPRLCLLVSTLQMLSCVLWLYGFVNAKTLNADTGEWEAGVGVLSEAVEADEETNCFGLVGAEVLLATFQCLFSMITVYQTMQIHELQARTSNPRFTKSEWLLTITGMLLGCYTYMAWMTASNRRCQRSGLPMWALDAQAHANGTDILGDLGYVYDATADPVTYLSVYVPWQHHFYPMYLVFDAMCGMMMKSYVNSLAAAFSSSGGDKGGGGTNQTVKIFQRFFNYEAKMILAGCALAVGIFVVQFILKAKALSMIACVFCVLMYVTYALRRVPMMMLYCQFPPFVNKFGMGLGGGSKSSAQIHPGGK